MPSKLSFRLSPATVTVVTTAETVVAQVGPFVYDLPVGGAQSNPGQGVSISADMNVTVGAGATAAVLRCRQGSITGPVVGVAWTVPVTASANANLDFEEFDTSRVPAQAGGVTYFVTVSFTGATGNSTVNECEVDVAGS
jgi:hypothetical protein